jgi:H+/gluconate symporter-like permease
MKIRGLLAGLLVAAALSGCTGSATAPEIHATTPAASDEAPPPPDTTTNRGGGAMGTGT